MGIELNLYAAELARVTIWIGQIQWMLRHGWGLSKDPILKPLDQISCRDAILNPDGTEAEWPAADCIVGNPPFLGDKKMISELGENYATALRQRFEGRVPGGANLVTYWLEKAWRQIESGGTQRAGLVATTSISRGSNREVLERIAEGGRIFEAWSDQEWVLEGAAVRVAIVCFTKAACPVIRLDAKDVTAVHSDLTASADNVTRARQLTANLGIAFQGTIKTGAFDISGSLARQWLSEASNVNGRSNSDVLRPWANGKEIVRRPKDPWIIDFYGHSESSAAMYQSPFQHLLAHVKEKRANKREESAAARWWLLQRPRPKMRHALHSLPRYIVTPRVSKYRLFVWLDKACLPDSRLYAIAREDDTTFGVLSSKWHEVWSLATCSWHGVGDDPTYNAESVFETFPFPEGLAPNVSAEQFSSSSCAMAISEAARSLNQLRDRWLNPPELVNRVPELVPGYPDRIIPVSEKAAAELKKRTLTNLYNQRPAWLAQAHQRLDEAVAAAYGWPADISEEEALKKLLELNLSRSA
jgi:type II restriction/modification system DNA methylase subunit YeeA